MSERLTIKEVAKALGTSEQTVRIGLQTGAFPFGSAVKTSGRYCYVIPKDKFDEWSCNR